ncbi:MAG: PqqD family protein, partial [Elusimicrobiota bacterium]
AVLFETRSEKVYTLSPTGAAVVREVIAGAQSATLVDKLKEKFEDPSGKMAAEAASFLSQLKEKGLIVE